MLNQSGFKERKKGFGQKSSLDLTKCRKVNVSNREMGVCEPLEEPLATHIVVYMRN